MDRISVRLNASQYFIYLFIYLFVILFSKFFFILLDYENDDEAKGLLDDSEENGKNN